MPNNSIAALILTVTFFLLSACKPSTPQHQGSDESLFENTKIVRDFAYGPDKRQTMDIYIPKEAKEAPVIMMLYGAGYYEADKTDASIYINKLKRWGPKGFIVVSISTRNLPQYDAYTQVQDLALAVATAQKNAAHWSGDPSQLFLMGHSSGGHLVSLLSAQPSLVTDLGGKKWLGSIALDSSTMDVPFTMRLRHPEFFDKAYGEDEKKWLSISPMHKLNKHSIPIFASCALQLKYNRCGDFEAFAKQADVFGILVEVYPLDANHGEANDLLGLNNQYTLAAEKFMAERSIKIKHFLQDNR